MECKGIEERLSPYLEGSLSPDEKAGVENHLATCRKCALTLEALKRTGDLVRGLDNVEPPSWLARRIMAQVKEEAESKRGLLQRLFYPLHIKIPVEAFATLFVVVLGLYVYKATGPEIKAIQEPRTAVQALPAEPPHGLPEKQPKKLSTPRAEKTFQDRLSTESRAIPRAPSGGKAETAKSEEKPVLSAYPGQSVGAIEKEADQDKGNQDKRVASTATPKESSQLQESPRTQSKSKDKADIPAPAAGAKDTGERKSQAVFRMREAPPPEKQPHIAVTVFVKDVSAMAKDVENLLRRHGGQKITRESREAAEVLTAELVPENVKGFLENLKTVGEVKEKLPRSEIQEKHLSIVIEIVVGP